MNLAPSSLALLAFESSCDETAVAVVNEQGHVLVQSLASQIEIHRVYGGVVPEVASRNHFEVVDALAREALAHPSLANTRIVGVAATRGPGLVGPLLVGASYAEGYATGRELPFHGVHHLRGHLASVLLPTDTSDTRTLQQRADEIFPALVLLVSGGHTQVLRVDSKLRARKLADTSDDAAGECLDKSAKLMGMPYPGGPAIEQKARELADTDRALAQEILESLPRPRSSEGFSFSGLKTAARQRLEREPQLKASPAFSWALQECVAQSLVRGLDRAANENPSDSSLKSLVFCGGVSANLRIRESMSEWALKKQLTLRLAPLKYCTDNAAMIAAAAWVQAPELELKHITSRSPLELP